MAAGADKLVEALQYIAGLSLINERIMEVVKGVAKWTTVASDGGTQDPHADGRRQAKILVVAAVVGVVLGVIGAYANVLGGYYKEHPEQAAALGLMSVGGSSFWNSILDSTKKLSTPKK